MKLCVLFHTADYRGDHAADVEIAYEVKPGETVEALAQRVLQPHRVNHYSQGDYISIRVVREPAEGDDDA